jgi:hypothetical protein
VVARIFGDTHHLHRGLLVAEFLRNVAANGVAVGKK